MSPRHSNTDAGWIKRRFAKIEKQLRESNAAKRLESATIGKGGLSVKRGGGVRGYFPSGRLAFEFGSIDEDAQGGDWSAYGLRILPDEDLLVSGGYPLMEIFAVPVSLPYFPTGARVVRQFGDIVIVKGTGVDGSVLVSAGEFTDPNNASVYVTTDDGVKLDGGSHGVKILHSTTGASANCFIDPSDSRIWRSTSSRRYKQDIEDEAVDPADVLQLRPRTWRDKGQVEANPDTETRYVGFIAEELDELPSMRQFVVYDAEGAPEAIAYDRLSVALLGLAQDHEQRIAALEAAAANTED